VGRARQDHPGLLVIGFTNFPTRRPKKRTGNFSIGFSCGGPVPGAMCLCGMTCGCYMQVGRGQAAKVYAHLSLLKMYAKTLGARAGIGWGKLIYASFILPSVFPRIHLRAKEFW